MVPGAVHLGVQGLVLTTAPRCSSLPGSDLGEHQPFLRVSVPRQGQPVSHSQTACYCAAVHVSKSCVPEEKS